MPPSLVWALGAYLLPLREVQTDLKKQRKARQTKAIRRLDYMDGGGRVKPYY